MFDGSWPAWKWLVFIAVIAGISQLIRLRDHFDSRDRDAAQAERSEYERRLVDVLRREMVRRAEDIGMILPPRS